MRELRFEWDERKAAANARIHKVSFDEARTVFFDENALLMPDPDHSDAEARFVLIGLSSALRAIVVCHCYRQATSIRIISARKANAAECGQYEGRTKP